MSGTGRRFGQDHSPDHPEASGYEPVRTSAGEAQASWRVVRSVARSDLAGATGIFHLAPAGRGDVPGAAVPGHRRIAPTGLPREGAYPRSPDPRGQSPGRFCAGTPAPREGSFGPWPPESGRDTTGGPRPPFGDGIRPAGTSARRVRLPPSDPVPANRSLAIPSSAGAVSASIGQGEACGDKWGELVGDQGLRG